MAGLSATGFRSWGLRQSLTNLDATGPTIVPGYAALYLCNDGSGQTLADAGPSGIHGTLGSAAGGDANDPAWAVGSLTFEADDYVDIPDHAIWATGTDNFTVGFLTKWTTAGRLLRQYASSSSYSHWISVGAAGGLTYRALGGGVTVNYGSADGAVPASAWAHVTVARSGAVMVLWVNGVPVALTETNAAGANSFPNIAADLSLGSTFGSGGIVGSIGAFYWYSSLLSDAQVRQMDTYLKALKAPAGIAW